MKFKERDIIVHEKGTELFFRILKVVGSDDIKEVYLGLWLTRKMRPSIIVGREYINIKHKELQFWNKTNEIGADDYENIYF